MAKVDEFKFVFFPETDHEVKVRARRIPGVNEELFDYWIDCMPIPRTVWSPALIAGHICYSHYLEMKVPMPYTIDELYNQGKFDLWYLDESKPGICTLFNGQGKNGEIICKWGPEVTEHMKYPVFAQVVDEDLDAFFAANQKIWDMTYCGDKREMPVVDFEL